LIRAVLLTFAVTWLFLFSPFECVATDGSSGHCPVTLDPARLKIGSMVRTLSPQTKSQPPTN